MSFPQGNQTAQALAAVAAARVPPPALQEFVWRRQRNFAVTQTLLKMGLSSSPSYAFLCVTLDDSALFGYNIAEAQELQRQAQQQGLASLVNFHPGADEVALVMLARAAAMLAAPRRLRVSLLWRLPAPQDVTRVPAFEGAPLNASVLQQLRAAGVQAQDVAAYAPAQACGVDFDVLLVVNNFDDDAQLEAAAQNFSLPTSQFEGLAAPVLAAATSGKCSVALADVRYANGAGRFFPSQPRPTNNQINHSIQSANSSINPINQ
jgi:hypothetical protein